MFCSFSEYVSILFRGLLLSEVGGFGSIVSPGLVFYLIWITMAIKSLFYVELKQTLLHLSRFIGLQCSIRIKVSESTFSFFWGCFEVGF